MRAVKDFRLLTGLAAMLAALGLNAAWKPVGTVQVASSQVMAPQVNALAAKANFPLLPMAVSAVLSENPVARLMGQLDARTGWGLRVFLDDKTGQQDMVYIWPLPEGRDAWLKAKSGRKLVNGLVSVKVQDLSGTDVKLHVAFSADGLTAYVSPMAELATHCVKAGVKPGKPLAKGLAAFEMDADEFRHFADAVLDVMLSDERKSDDDGPSEIFPFTPEKFPKVEFRRLVETCVREIDGVRMVLGVSNSGLDVRFRFHHRSGGTLANAVRPLPADAVKFIDVPANATLALVATRLPGPENAFAASFRQFYPVFLRALEAHFEKSIRMAGNEKDAAEFRTLLRVFAFQTAALRTFAASSATCESITFSISEGRALRSAFRVAGVKGAVPQRGQPPEIVKVTNGGGVYSVVAEQPGFNPGKGAFAASFAQAVPEYAQLKSPLFVGRLQTGFAFSVEGAEDKETEDETTEDESMCSLWAVGWQDRSAKRPGVSTRVLVRLPAREFGQLISKTLRNVSPESER